MAKQSEKRSMQTLGLAYPYWENAARAVEDRCMALLVLALALVLLPVVLLLLIFAVLYAKLGKDKLENELWPKLKANTQEAVRARQRKHWEKTHSLEPENKDQ